MGLSEELISQFVQVTNDTKQKKNSESTVYGQIVEYEGNKYVRIDGSELLTPVSATASSVDGDRVTVLIKNHTATVTGNISSPSARVDDLTDQTDAITALEIVVARKVDTKDLVVEQGRIDALITENATIKESLTAAEANIEELQTKELEVTEKLTAAEADIENLKVTKLDIDVAEATYVKIENLTATEADIHELNATYATFVDTTTERLDAVEADITSLQVSALSAEEADLDYATIDDLNATKAIVTDLESEVADIDTLIFGSATGNVIQTSFANAVIAQLGDAQIKSAMIDNISASKITSGDIITNNVRVMSEDGKLVISDETIQISDSTRVRVQIGKDSGGDYSINIWDASGNLMFSEGGITDNAIKEAIIRNDMVSESANISASKLDIDSLFEEINGSANTIKSSRVYLDDKGQSLDVAFSTVTSQISEIQNGISSQGAQIEANTESIASKVWQSDIDTATSTLSTKYTSLEQEVDSISTTVASHTATIENKADASTVTTIDEKVTSLEANLNGFESTVSATYATKTELNAIEVGGRNYVLNSDVEKVASGYYAVFQLSDAKSALQDKTVVVSFDAKKPEDGDAVNMYAYFRGSSALTPSSNRIGDVTSEYKRYYVTIPAGTNIADATHISIHGSIAKPNVSIKNVKVEIGTIPTDWTPAPEDVTSDIATADAKAQAAQEAAAKNASDMAKAITDFNNDIDNLQVQIDGSITTWFYSVAPTDSNQPAVDWTTTDQKNTHLGDLYYDTITGYCYRYQVENNVYSWQRITDTDVTKALSDAKTAQDTADQKRRVFYVQPTVPYDAGDLWVQGSAGDILRCQTAKAKGQAYSASDWVIASKYTDDTTANLAAQAAATAQNAVDGLEDRVTTAETSIQQNKNSITSIATRTTTVENKFSKYSTTEQMNSAISQSAASVTSQVSSTYATKSALETTQNTANSAKESIDNLTIGGRNYLTESDYERESPTTYLDYSFVKDIDWLKTKAGQVVTLSFDAKGNDQCTYQIDAYFRGDVTTYNSGNPVHDLTTDYVRYSQVMTIPTISDDTVIKIRIRGNQYVGNKTNTGSFYVQNVKLEFGNKATDWSPALEDVVLSDELETVQSSADLIEERVTTAETLIQQLSDSIATLVTDSNGESLMVQTGSGWTFSTGEIQSIVESTSENLSALSDEMDDVNSTVQSLQQALADLGILGDYIKIGSYEGEPCIELGESDSDFKLLITNTRIMFMEGSGLPAYFNNQSMFIKKAVIEEELQQGEFVWKARSNGNLGLIWKGATS